MKMKNKLKEGLSSILFHSTSLYNAIMMLKNDEAKLSSLMAKGAEEELKYKDNLFYFSTSRTRTGAYHKDLMGHISVLFVLDGKKLSENFSGKAIDYWGPSFREIDPTSFESEDRLYSKKEKINNFSKYIISIDIYLDPEDSGKYTERYLVPFYMLAKKMDIPVNIFTSKQDFYTGKRPQKFTDIVKRMRNKENYDTSRDLETNEVGRRSSKHDKKDVSAFLLLVMNDDEKSLPPHAKELLRKIRYRSEDEMTRKLQAAFHNLQNDDLIKKATKVLTKFNLSNVKSAMNYVKEKWGQE